MQQTPKKTHIFKRCNILKRIKNFIYKPAMRAEDTNNKMWSVFILNMSRRSRSK